MTASSLADVLYVMRYDSIKFQENQNFNFSVLCSDWFSVYSIMDLFRTLDEISIYYLFV